MQGLGGGANGLGAGAGMSGEKNGLPVDMMPLKFLGYGGPFNVMESGLYLIVFQGQGTPYHDDGEGDAGNGFGGAIVGKYRNLKAGDSLTWTGDVLTFPDGTMMGQTRPANVALHFGGDFGTNGSNGISAGSYGPFIGGSGGNIGSGTPGGGGFFVQVNYPQLQGGVCRVTAIKISN